MIRLACIDVDGTIVGTAGRVHDAVWPAIDDARAAGLRLAICSGRPGFGLALDFATRIDPDGWHSFQNGASVLRLPSGGSRSRALPQRELRLLIDQCRSAGLLLELYSDLDYAVEQETELARAHAGLLGVPFHPRPFETLDGVVVRAQLIHHGEPPATVDALYSSALLLSPSITPAMPEVTFLSVTPAGVDKAAAVRLIAAEYGIAHDEVMYVGDGRNDVTAMRLAGLAIAMGNAEPEALAVARRVVADVDQGGLAEALRLATVGARVS